MRPSDPITPAQDFHAGMHQPTHPVVPSYYPKKETSSLPKIKSFCATKPEDVLPEGAILPVTGEQLLRLLRIFAHKRPHDSKGEKAWVLEHLIDRYTALGVTNKGFLDRPQYEVKLFGPMQNVVIYCNSDKNPETLFSCHTDTVHYTDGVQDVVWDAVNMEAFKDDNLPLGADDGTGMWIMMRMLDEGVPGVYAFHRGEERGCIGSGWMKANEKEWLKQFKRAIAFDRRDTTHVITSQRGRVCCSNGFGDALALALNRTATFLGFEFKYKSDPTGVYTDTANYTAYIPECTNLSIGYEGAHGGTEKQDVRHAALLAEVAIHLDWKSLPTHREAKEDKYEYNYSGGRYSGRSYSAAEDASNDEGMLPWSMYLSFSDKRKDQKAYEVANRSLEAVAEVVMNPPDSIHDYDMMNKRDRMTFARCFPEQNEYIVEELLTIRRRYNTLRKLVIEQQNDVTKLRSEISTLKADLDKAKVVNSSDASSSEPKPPDLPMGLEEWGHY